MNRSLCFVCSLFLLVGAKCTQPDPPESALSPAPARFLWQSEMPDTLHCFLTDSIAGAVISDTLLRTVLDSAQFESLHFGTGEARFRALGRFPFAEGLSAALLRTEEFWFGKQSLLVFDRRGQHCLAVIELAHFYGGDGGQTASESWLIRNNGTPRLYTKNAEHGFILSGTTSEEAREYLHEYGKMMQWESTSFRPVAEPDSLLLLQKFRMNRRW